VVNYFKIVFLLVICASFGVAFVLTRQTQVASCTPIPQQAPEIGSHGWLMWSNDSYKAFTPEHTSYCIEAGWEPVGATIDSAGNAVFPTESTGVFIKTSDFIAKEVLLADGETSLRVLYPTKLTQEEIDAYLRTITAVFTDVTTLYATFDTTKLAGHTVFISVGIAGDANDVKTSIYPTPTKQLTVFGRNLDHRRGEELFTHAVTHLLNRHFTEGLTYQQNQAPIPASDWQELESSWAEVAFLSDDRKRLERVEDLYAVHQSVFSGTFSSALEYPFNEKTIYDQVHRTSLILGPNPSYGEIQYSHYVLAPLLLVSIDGLLLQQSASTSVNTLIQTAVTENKNFFILLQQYLSEKELEWVHAVIFGKALIPYELLEAGTLRYSKGQ
jgi:hypothetical protein